MEQRGSRGKRDLQENDEGTRTRTRNLEEGTQETKPEYENNMVGERRISTDPNKCIKWTVDDKRPHIERIPDHHIRRYGKRTKGGGRLQGNTAHT